MTAAQLYEMLDRLPYQCDDFLVRLSTTDRTDWVQPEGWYVDDDGDVILLSDCDCDEMTVDDLKRLLDGGNNDWCNEGNEVYDDAIVYVEDYNDDDYVWEVIRKRFSINWKRNRVDIWMV